MTLSNILRQEIDITGIWLPTDKMMPYKSTKFMSKATLKIREAINLVDRMTEAIESLEEQREALIKTIEPNFATKRKDGDDCEELTDKELLFLKLCGVDLSHGFISSDVEFHKGKNPALYNFIVKGVEPE